MENQPPDAPPADPFLATMPDGTVKVAEWAFWSDKNSDVMSQIRCRTASIWAVSPRLGVLDNLGSGFVLRSAIDSKGREIIIVGSAEHVLDYALRPLRPEVQSSRHGPFARPLARLVSPLLTSRQLIVTIDTGAGFLNYAVNGVSVSTRSDLCLLKAVATSALSGPPWFDASTSTSESPTTPHAAPHFAIDSDPLSLGTKLLLVGYPGAHDPEEKAKQTLEAGKISVERRPRLMLQVRIGKIVEVCDRLRHKPVFGYETNIPMPAGMSGGPVFAFDQNSFTPLSVVGVCSFDAKAWELGDDVTQPGSSFIVASQNFYCVPDPVTANHRAWNERKPGDNTPPPFANMFLDKGQHKNGLRVTVDEESGSPTVIRLSQ